MPQDGTSLLFTPETISGTLQNPAFQLYCETTNSDATVTVQTGGGDVENTADLYAGLPVSGTGIPVSTTVLSVTNSTTFELSANATATSSGVTLTFTPASAAIVGRISNPNLNKGWDLAVTAVDNLGRIDTKRWDGRNITGTVDFECYTTTARFPRQGASLTIAGLTDSDLNRTYTITQVGAPYPKGAFVVYPLTVECNQRVEML